VRQVGNKMGDRTWGVLRDRTGGGGYCGFRRDRSWFMSLRRAIGPVVGVPSYWRG
jgi:hypothetical protein